jgi:DNA ligase-1
MSLIVTRPEGLYGPAKACSGLSGTEMARADAVIRKTTLESFGTVRSVQPTLVFALGFEGIARR